jgi:hypothetical protein
MQTRNTSIPTQYKEHPYTWYAVVATAIQMPVDFEEEGSELSWGPPINNHNFSEKKSITPLTTTLISFDPSNHRIPSVTTFSQAEAITDFDGDIVIKPKYTQEFKIKVRSLKVDKSLPKIFID